MIHIILKTKKFCTLLIQRNFSYFNIRSVAKLSSESCRNSHFYFHECMSTNFVKFVRFHLMNKNFTHNIFNMANSNAGTSGWCKATVWFWQAKTQGLIVAQNTMYVFRHLRGTESLSKIDINNSLNNCTRKATLLAYTYIYRHIINQSILFTI